MRSSRARGGEFPAGAGALRLARRNGPASPLLSKLYQSPTCASADGVARINPATARSYGVCDGGALTADTLRRLRRDDRRLRRRR